MTQESAPGRAAAETQGDAVALAARVALALCHDFAGPLGAVTLGLDLLAEEVGGLAESDAWRVIGDGLRALDSRLTFARAAYGASKDTATTADIEHAARALLAGSKVELVWRVGRPILPPSVGGLLLHLAQLALSALPRGGVVAVSVEERPASLRLLVEAKGPFARLKSGTPEGLSGAASPPGPAADWTRAAYTRAIAGAIGGAVQGESAEGWARLIAELPRDI